MKGNFQSTRPIDRGALVAKILDGLFNWAIMFASIPLVAAAKLILLIGGVLIEATGGKPSNSVSLQAVLIRGILLAIFAFNSWQYSTQVASIAAAIAWLPWWSGGIIGGILNAVTQLLQARLLRRDTVQSKRRAYERVKAQRVPSEELDEQIDIAKAKGRAVNSAEMLKYRTMGLFAIGAWVIELYIMASSPLVDWRSPWFNFANIPVALLTLVFAVAFEVFAQLDEEV